MRMLQVVVAVAVLIAAFDRLVLWVERGEAPPLSQTVKPQEKLK